MAPSGGALTPEGASREVARRLSSYAAVCAAWTGRGAAGPAGLAEPLLSGAVESLDGYVEEAVVAAGYAGGGLGGGAGVVPRIAAAELTPYVFLTEYLLPNRPVCITGVSSTLDAGDDLDVPHPPEPAPWAGDARVE